MLVPVDGSDGALRALTHAVARKAADKRIQVHVLYVARGVSPSRLVSRRMISDWQDQERKTALGGKRVKALLKKTGAQVHAVTGEPAAAILAFASENKISEIVMGTRGLGQLEGLLMGSVASKVVQLAPMPVTLVK
jgi:nucleotide-binding universal stress UspA family protein